LFLHAEAYIIEALKTYIAAYQGLGVFPPVVSMISMTGVMGAKFSLEDYPFVSPDSIDRDTPILPEIILESLDANLPTTMRPAFDAFWNACGFDRSYSFSDDGKLCWQ